MEKWEQFLPYKCVLEGGTGEIVEKRSRFFGGGQEGGDGRGGGGFC